MLLTCLLLSLAQTTSAATQGSLLATVPDDAYALVHCRDVADLRSRAERNDWFRLLGTRHGEPFLAELAYGIRNQTHSEMDELLAMARALEGEAVFFDTGAVAGFVAAPPADRTELVGLVRAWMPDGDPGARQTLEISGGTVELFGWPAAIDGWSGRAGHVAAFVDHPRALAVYSGDDKAAVLAAVTRGVLGLSNDERAPLVAAYLAEGGGKTTGIEFFIDFTPHIAAAEAALKDLVQDVLPDPSDLLGLEKGTWLHASADVFAGAQVDCRARLHIPPGTLAARLADTFQPLPHTLPADLPKGIWGLWALNWDLKVFYQRARAAFEDADRGAGLAVVDSGIDASRAMVGVDPIVDVVNQLAGNFAFYMVELPEGASGEMAAFRSLGFQLGLVDGDEFLTAFEKLTEVGDLASVFTFEQFAGADLYLFDEDEFNGGLAFLPNAFSVALSRALLLRNVQALTRADGASLLDGSRMQAAIDESAGACFLTCVELTPLRALVLPDVEGELRLPPLAEGAPARDPFDAQLLSTARRTRDGFLFRIQTR